MSVTRTAELTRGEAEDLLYLEANLLDDRRFGEWLELFDDECHYWLPILEGSDPALEASIVNDDRARLEERVFRLLATPAHAQTPPSRTQHDVTNVVVEPGAGAGEAHVRCNLTVWELRPGDVSQAGLGHQRAVAARCRYRLVWREGWRIAGKTCLLLDREAPLYNLTFVV